MSETRSNITLLRARDMSYGGSARITTDFLHTIGRRQNNQWRNRREFFMTTLVMCMNLGSLWRFPKQMLLFGNGSFLWLYILFTFLIANSLVFFEVALGQYSSKGFAKVFAMCPLFEGICYSMVFYCLFLSIFYNFINVTSLTYFYTSFYSVLPYQICLKTADICQKNGTLTNTPEYTYFHHKVLLLYENDDANAWSVNWKNVGAVFSFWILVCIAIIKGMKAIQWISIIYCPLAYIILLTVLAGTLITKGAWKGVRHMILPTKRELFTGNIWWQALEQSLVNLCLGMGPLITYGSFSRFQSPAHIDGFYISCAVTLISILSGMVMFATVGIVAEETGQDVGAKLLEYKEIIGIDTAIIYSQLFSRVPRTLQHFSAVLFFFLHTFAGWYSLISYIEVFNYALLSTGRFKRNSCYRAIINVAVCVFCAFLGSLLCFRDGYKYMEAFDKYFLALSLVIIIICELVGVVYIYGVFDLCDDIEFMLGSYPNIYYQITWIGAPVLMIIALGFEFYDIAFRTFTAPNIVMFCMVFVFIVCPILVQSIYNVVVAWLSGDASKVLRPREAIVDDSYDTPVSLYARSTPTSYVTPLTLMNL